MTSVFVKHEGLQVNPLQCALLNFMNEEMNLSVSQLVQVHQEWEEENLNASWLSPESVNSLSRTENQISRLTNSELFTKPASCNRAQVLLGCWSHPWVFWLLFQVEVQSLLVAEVVGGAKATAKKSSLKNFSHLWEGVS